MDKFTYKIGGVTYTQSELTWGQDKKIMALAQKAQVKLSGKEEITFAAIPDILRKQDLLARFLSLVLKPRFSPALIWMVLRNALRGNFGRLNVDKATNSQIQKIFDDFFLLNKPLIEKLSSLGDLFSRIAQASAKDEKTASKSSISTMKEKTGRKDPEQSEEK